MTSETHSRASEIWLWFFFICFAIVLVGIGLLAVCTYPSWLTPPEPGSGPAGEHGMLAPEQQAQPRLFA